MSQTSNGRHTYIQYGGDFAIQDVEHDFIRLTERKINKRKRFFERLIAPFRRRINETAKTTRVFIPVTRF